jgi:hypothetical protein
MDRVFAAEDQTKWELGSEWIWALEFLPVARCAASQSKSPWSKRQPGAGP